MTTTIALYSHDSVGLGHARRNRALAFALAEHLPKYTGGEVRGLLIAGHPDAGADSLPEGWDWLILPGLTRSSDQELAPRNLGISSTQLVTMRSKIIESAITALDPDLLIVDRHPFGMEGELMKPIRELRRRGGKVVLGLREVLDTPATVEKEWEELGGANFISQYLDAVWLYGDDNVYDARTTGELPPALAKLAEATGYLAKGRPASPDHVDLSLVPYVLTVLGGGSDGAHIARAALEAKAPEGHHHILVTGPQMPAHDIEALRERAAELNAFGAKIKVRRHVAHVPELIEQAEAVVSMAGYNTIAEILMTNTASLVIPREARRQEQILRTSALADKGYLDMLRGADLNPHNIEQWWHDNAGKSVDRDSLSLNGLIRVPFMAAELLNRNRMALSS